MNAPCPPMRVLEDIAAERSASDAYNGHVAACDSCQAALREIRENRQFLSRAVAALRVAEPGVSRTAIRGAPFEIPGFELHDEISRGGQGVVFRAVQVDTKRPAAVKVLLSGEFATARQQSRFEREIEIAARLRHPGIVSIFESGVASDGRRFVAMEYVDGRPLDQYVRVPPDSDSGRQRVDRLLRLCAAIASAVGHAHANGVIHRDLKPSNIVVDASGRPHVLDFGLARELDRLSDRTKTSDFAGTPAYASPEQFESDPTLIDARTDVYSLGVIMYQLLTGTHPYPCDVSLPAMMEHVRSTTPYAPSRRVSHLSTDIDTIVLKALSKEPERRYRNGEALATDIQDSLAGLPISARRDSTLYVLGKLALRHRIAVAIAGAALLMIIAATSALALLSSRLNVQRLNAETALAESTLQRARLLARTGNSLQAERLLWNIALDAGLDENADLGLESNPIARQAAWGLLEFYARVRKLATFETGDRMAAFSFEADGSGIRSVHSAGSLKRWSLTGRLLSETPKFLNSAITVACISGDQCYAVTLDARGALSVYDLAAQALINGPRRSPDCRQVVSVSEDGALFLTTSTDGVVRLHDTCSLNVRRTLDPQVVDGVLCHDYLVLTVIADNCSEIHVRSLYDFHLVSTLHVRHQHPDVVSRYATSVSRDGHYILVSNEAHLYLYDALHGGDPIAVRLGTSPFGRAEFDAGGEFAVTMTIDGTMTKWSIPDLVPRRVTRIGPTQRSVALFDKLAASARSDGSLTIWHEDDTAWPTRLRGSAPSMHALALSADESTLAFGDDQGWLRLQRLSDGLAAREPIKAHRDTVKSIEYSPDGARILTAGTDGAVREWTDDGALIREIARDLKNVQCARYSPDGSWIAAGARDGSVYIWNNRGPLARRTLGNLNVRIPQVEFSRDGVLLAALSECAGAVLWDVKSGRQTHTLRRSSLVSRAMTFAPDGTTLAIGDDGNTISFWDVRSGALLRTFDGLPWGPFEMQYHPSGRVLVAVGRGGEMIVVDPDSCRELAAFPAHEALPFSLRFSKDGRRIFTAGEDDWIGVWNLDHLRECARGNAVYQRTRLGSAARPPR